MKVFVSYRRDDSADVTGRIHDRLIKDFGNDAVYMDVDSIPLGVDFRRHLDGAVAESDVVLVIIGPSWLEAVDRAGQSRLADPGDFVRVEVESALSRNVPVVPVLVRGAVMPQQQDLPNGIAELAFRQGTVVRPDPDFHTDMDRVTRALRAATRESSTAALAPATAAFSGNMPGGSSSESSAPRSTIVRWLPVALAAIVLLVGILVWLTGRDPGSDSTSESTSSLSPTTTGDVLGQRQASTAASAPTTITLETTLTAAPAPATTPTTVPTVPAAAGPTTLSTVSTAHCPSESDFDTMEQVPDAELARDVTPRADPMLVLLQMRVQGTSDQQIVSVCWDQQFGNYWYFSRGVGHPAHGVLAVARKMTDGFIADYPPSHATSYYLKADGVHIVRNGVDDETHGTVPDVSGAPGLICADLATLPAAMSDQVNGDVPPCATGTVLPWS